MLAGTADFAGNHGGVSTDVATILATVPGGVDAVLNLWAGASGFSNLGSVADTGGAPGGADGVGEPGDIRIGAYAFDGAFGVLAHAFQPGTNAIFAFGTIGGDTHFDNAETWADDSTDTNADADFDTFTVLLHELGHALGLGHSAVVGSVMEPIYAGARRSLHADDIAGIMAIYGAAATGPVDPIPEPGLLALLGVALLGIAVRRKRAA